MTSTPGTTGISAERQRAELIRLARASLTFLIVLIGFAVLWQVIKAVFHLDSLVLPNLGDIATVFTQPIVEGKPPLGTLLLNAALFTFREAALGFALGASFGFALAILFAHSRFLERGLMPFIVASQTIPILAIAPMVVVWLKLDWLSVAVIAAYLTFFPVTINTLRGLLSVPPTALELMQSYAASQRQILVKLRIPHALPYIFAALKVSATASVVGSIIGELPSGIQSGLGYSIIVYDQYYTQVPARLWATNLTAALVGIAAFGIVALAERIIVRWSPEENKP